MGRVRRRGLVRLPLLARRLRDPLRNGRDPTKVDRVAVREVVHDVQPDIEPARARHVDREQVDDDVVEFGEGELPARAAVDGVPARDERRACNVGPPWDLGERQGTVCGRMGSGQCSEYSYE